MPFNQSPGRHLRSRILIFAISYGCVGSETSKSVPSATDSLIGTWRVVSHLPSSGADRSSLLPLGERPRGYLVYDGTGHVFLQVQRPGAADSIRYRSWRDAPDSVLEVVLEGFRAYFGTYTVDAAARVVTHRIEGEFLPRAGHVELATPFRLDADSLVLGSDSLERWVLVRVRE